MYHYPWIGLTALLCDTFYLAVSLSWRFDGRRATAWDHETSSRADFTWEEVPDTVITNQASSQVDLPTPEASDYLLLFLGVGAVYCKT